MRNGLCTFSPVILPNNSGVLWPRKQKWRRPQMKTTQNEDDQRWKWPKMNMTNIEDDKKEDDPKWGRLENEDNWR